MLKLSISCPEHPRYTAQRKPKDCIICMAMHKFRVALECEYEGIGGYTHDATGILDPTEMKIQVLK